ncbi:DUF2802 domain-containing protein [Hahella sp. SMD15-11]|uniref:DUF2802 domain-containing protein n=1 Tax=Thermohahella caldifontis TaxID=3142973 RepID=A0AB39UXJ1_9GAMM
MQPDWLVPALGILSLVAVPALGMALHLWRRLTLVSVKMEQLERDLGVEREATQAMGRRLLMMEKRFAALQRKHRELEAEDAQRVSYNEAVRLLQMGASIDELVETCGLSRAEAELISVLQRTDHLSD